MWLKLFAPWKVTIIVVTIVVVNELTYCALLDSTDDLKTAQMNIQYNLIQELMLYKSELRHHTTESTKNICCVKGEGTVDQITQIAQEISLRLQKPCRGCCEMCRMYRTKFWGRACSSQIISLTKKKQNLNNFKIKIYYSDWIIYKETHNVDESTVSVINVVVVVVVFVCLLCV